MEETVSYSIVLLVIIGYMAIYLGSRKYFETFKDSAKHEPPAHTATPPAHTATPPVHNATPPAKHANASLPEKHYPAQPERDNYEVSAVFHNQGSREASQKQISDAMTRYPLDWSTQGHASQEFQEKQVQYTKDSKYATHPSPYTPQGMEAPVAESLEEEERKILKTYQPKSSKDLLTYSVDDVKNLLDKVYDKKGLIPVINKSKQGDNIWEITEVKEKNPKIVWEDDVDQHKSNIMRQRGENNIEVPHPASDLAAGLNPFMNPRQRVGKGKHDNPQWTPGVDRMFTPSFPIPSWN